MRHRLPPLWLVLPAIGGCYLSHQRARFDAGAPDADEPVAVSVPGCAEPVSTRTPDAPVPPVDVLFVVDDSGSMVEEQAALGSEFPLLVRALATGDHDGDGLVDTPPVSDLHVGVVTSDLGLAELVCSGAGVFGDDGVLRAGCGLDGYFLSYAAPAPTIALEEGFACLANVGVVGCGVEQPLEAALRAVTPSTSSLWFPYDRTGHADGLNAGFLRAGAILAIVVVTDEDDMSLADADRLLALDTHDELEAALPEALQPIERYATGLRAGREERFFLGVVAGVPPDLAGEGADWAAVLDDPRMARTWDETGAEPELVPACAVPGRGRAAPGRRLVELVASLGPQAAAHSICEPSFADVLARLGREIGTVVERVTCPDGP